MSREYHDDQLDELLREHLGAALDGQLGRSRRAFLEHVSASGIAPGASPGSRGVGRSRVWAIGLVGGAMAASLAALWAVPIVWPSGNPVVTTNVHSTGQPYVASSSPLTTRSAAERRDDRGGNRWEQLAQVVSCATQDKGVVMIDGDTPARLVRRISTERTQWVDEESGLRVETVVPREHEMLIQMDTY